MYFAIIIFENDKVYFCPPIIILSSHCCCILAGELRPTVQKWFVEKKECSSGNTLLEKLIDFPTTFVKHTEVNGPYLFDDEDVGAWEAEARRWARTLLLVTSEEQHFTQIFVVCFVHTCF